MSILRNGTAFPVHEVHWQDVDATQCEFRCPEHLLQEIFRKWQVGTFECTWSVAAVSDCRNLDFRDVNTPPIHYATIRDRRYSTLCESAR